MSPDHPDGMKPKESQIRWIIRRKKGGRGEITNAQIAESVGMSVRRVQKM